MAKEFEGNPSKSIWTKCSICGNACWDNRLKEQYCKDCGSAIYKEIRWDRWDKQPHTIFSYDVEELLEYLKSRCPNLYRDLLSQHSDTEREYSMAYRGDERE
jgi:ribosomal protein L37E